MPKDYAKLMKACWNKKPSKRPEFSKIVKELVRMYKAVQPDFTASPGKDIPVASSSTPNLLSKFLPSIKRSDSVPPNSLRVKSTPVLNLSSQSVPETVSSDLDSSSKDESDNDTGSHF